MRSLLAKKVVTITAAAFILLAITTLTIVTTFATANAESSVRVSQSNNDGSSSVIVQSDEDGLEVNCEGDVNCEVIGDDTVVATSEDGNITNSTAVTSTTTTDTTTNVDQPDLDDLDDRIEEMVDRLLDEVSANLVNWRMSLFT